MSVLVVRSGNELTARRRSVFTRTVRMLLAVAAFTGLFIAIAGLAHYDFDRPLTYFGDALWMQGYYEHNYVFNDIDLRLHAPFELEHAQTGRYWFNALFQSNSNLIWISWLLAGGNDVRALNYAYFATFLLVFLSAYWACGSLGLKNPFRFGAASLYALMPYHFGRTVAGHLWESSYYLTPLLALVIVRLWSARPLAHRWSESGWVFDWRDPRALFALILIVFFSSFHPYHQFFFACLAASVAPLAALYRRSWRHLLVGLVLAAAAVAVLALKSALLHSLVTPELALSNNGQAIGGYGGAESYPLKLAQMVLPVQSHRWHPFAELRAIYDRSNPLVNENSTTTLGLVGACGLLALFALAWVPMPRIRNSRLGKMGTVALLAVLFAMMGGVSSLLSTASLILLGPTHELTQMRGWDRIVIYIAFYAYFAAFFVLGNGARELLRRFPAIPAAVLTWPICMGVLAFALWDAIPGPFYQADPTRYLSDRTFFSKIESILPPGARIAQLPYLIHHDGWINGVFDTDALRPYLNTKTLHFTYGGDSGSAQAAWLHRVAARPAPEKASLLCSYGFSGVLVQNNMLPDPAPENDALTAASGTAPLTSSDGDYTFHDLRSFCTSHAIATLDMHAVKRQLIAQENANEHSIAAEDMGGQIGHLEYGTDAATRFATADEEGFLAFGPGENLQPGHYQVKFRIVATGTSPNRSMDFDVAGAQGGAEIVKLTGTSATLADATKPPVLAFDVSPGTTKIQYRVFKPRGYEARFSGVEVTRTR